MAADKSYPKRNTAILVITLCCVGWAVSFPTLKSVEFAAPAASADTFFTASLAVGARFVLASAVLLAFQPLALLRATRSEWKQGGFLGLFSTLGLVLQMDGLRYTDASVAAFLTQGYCLWIPLWQALTRRTWPPWHVWGSVGLVTFGCALLAGVKPGAFHLGRGELENIAGSVFFAAQILWLERPEFERNSVSRFTLVMFAVMALAGLVLARAHTAAWTDLWGPWMNKTNLLLVIILIGVSTMGPFLMANRWQRELPAAEAGLVYCAEPVFTSLISLFLPGLYSAWFGFNYPNERPGWSLAAGGACILVANVWLQWADRRRAAGQGK
jgi:drug/metabolite transporter (DMT)-like permease